MSKPKVFISYCKSDSTLARRLHDDLSSANADVWQFDATAVPGTDSWDPILEAIEKSDFFIVLISASAVKSRGVDEEISHAHYCQLQNPSERPIAIPLILDPSVKVPRKISRLVRIHFPLDDYSVGLAALLKAIIATGRGSSDEGLCAHLESTGNTAQAISKRLRDIFNYLFTWGNKMGYYSGKGISMAQIARELGYPDASKLDAVYRGDVPLSFEDGDKICKIFGIYITWLEEGKGTPFLQTQLFGDSLKALRNFYEKGVYYTSLCFALSDEVRGEALVYGEISPFRYELLLSNLPIHDDVGGCGTGDLLNFCYFLAMFCYLKDAKTNIMRRAFGYLTPRMVGVILDSEKYRALANGSLHPGEIFDKPVIQHSNWFEDLADIDLPKSYSSDSRVHYTNNWQRAFDFIKENLKLQNICSNSDLIKFVYSQYLKPLRPLDFQIVSMLKKNDDGGENRALEHYEDIVEKAKSSESSEERKQVWRLFNENRMALPEWLDSVYIECVEPS